MRIAEVIGKLTLGRCHPSLRGAAWKVVVPLNRNALAGDSSGRGEAFVVYDELGAGSGSLIGASEGAEASAPFYPKSKPVDGYAAAILDSVEVK